MGALALTDFNGRCNPDDRHLAFNLKMETLTYKQSHFSDFCILFCFQTTKLFQAFHFSTLSH